MEFQYVLIAIGIILAVFLLYFGFTHLIKNKDLSQKVSSTIDVQTLIQALGGRDNITDVSSSPSKLTVGIRDHHLIRVDDIKELGASGIVEGNGRLSMIFGKQSPLIEEDLKHYL